MFTTPTLATLERPAAGVWQIDPGHAEVGFVGRHLGLTKVRGRFTGVTGLIVIGEDPASSSVDVTIDMASVASGDQSRDDHLRSPDLFDVGTYPTASYRSTAVSFEGRAGTIDGELTIKGISRPVRLDADYVGQAVDPWGNERAVFSARTRINREDWGLTWNMVLEAGGLLVSKEIRLEIDVELVRETP